MSYCRMGPDSAAYIFATKRPAGRARIECCGCLLLRDDTGNGYVEFCTYGDLLRHINEHRAAGHRIPDRVEERIQREIANPEQQWLPVGKLPKTILPNP